MYVRTVITALAVAVLAGAVPAETPRFMLELEAGPAWQTRNDVQIPNDETADRFSLIDVLGKGPWPAARLYFTWNINNRHGLRLLLAPLSVTETGTLPAQTRFQGETYPADAPVEATYKFNSYRLTYRYRYYDNERFTGWVGFTAKIRDAKIELDWAGPAARLAAEDPASLTEAHSKKTDLGFVPLLHLAGDYRFADRWHGLFDVDALAGGPGRAIDGTVKLGYDINDDWTVSGGYRTVEGGADVDSVYNFAWIHYAVLALQYGF